MCRFAVASNEKRFNLVFARSIKFEKLVDVFFFLFSFILIGCKRLTLPSTIRCLFAYLTTLILILILTR